MSWREEVEQLPWFHSHISRHQAEALLMQNGQDGSYLLRESSTNIGEYSLSVKSTHSVKHFQIGWDGKYFTFGMGKFSSFDDFVKHFENQPLIGGESGLLTLLRYPYVRHVEEPAGYDDIHVHAEWGNTPNHVPKAPDSINSKEGYLTKQGAKVKSWKTRWFVLCQNELKYYRMQGDALPIRTLDLTKCLSVEEDETMGKNHLIRIEMPMRTFYVYASTESEKNDWYSILRWKLKKLRDPDFPS